MQRRTFFDFWGVRNAFLAKSYKCKEFVKTSILSLVYQTLHTKKPFCDEMFLEISVRENLYLICQSTWFCVLAIFRGACVRTHELKK